MQINAQKKKKKKSRQKMPKPNQSTTWDNKFKRRRFQTTPKKIKQKHKSRYECHARIIIVLT